jgi:hypothetical protein
MTLSSEFLKDIRPWQKVPLTERGEGRDQNQLCPGLAAGALLPDVTN